MAKIDVVFNDSSNETAGTQSQQEPQQNKSNNASSYMVGQAVVQLGKRALSYGASMVGNITGNYIMQSNIDNMVSIIGYASQIGVGIAAGGVAGGVASAIAVAGQIAINGINYENIIPAFEKKTGIKVHLTSLGTGEATARLDAEKANPTIDVMFGGVNLGVVTQFPDIFQEPPKPPQPMQAPHYSSRL